MTSFAGWNFLGASSGVLLGQGVNMLMNVFFGVAVNAARGIAGQVDNAINMLVNNFTVALNPQITKSYASGDLKYMHDLVCKGAKYSFFIMLLPSLPILLETETILQVWLKQVPEMTVVFLRLTILISLNSVLSQTLIASMLANGHIKKYQIVVGGLNMLIFPLSYVAFKLGLPSYASYVIQFFIFFIELIARLVLLKEMVSLSISKYLNQVLLRITYVSVLSIPIPIFFCLFMPSGIIRLLISILLCLICTAISIYYFCLEDLEQKWIKKAINKYI